MNYIQDYRDQLNTEYLNNQDIANVHESVLTYIDNFYNTMEQYMVSEGNPDLYQELTAQYDAALLGFDQLYEMHKLPFIEEQKKKLVNIYEELPPPSMDEEPLPPVVQPPVDEPDEPSIEPIPTPDDDEPGNWWDWWEDVWKESEYNKYMIIIAAVLIGIIILNFISKLIFKSN